MEGKKSKIKTKKGVLELSVIAPVLLDLIPIILAIILAIIFIAIGLWFWNNSKGEAAPDINCASWAGAPAGYQDKITAAANKAGIQPALLGAIFLSENGDNWGSKPVTSTDWPSGGPFQVTDGEGNWDDTWAGVTAAKLNNGLDTEQARARKNEFDISAIAAAFELKRNFDHPQIKLPDNSSTQTAITFAGLAYNTGISHGLEWAKAGYDLAKHPDSLSEWGNPGTHDYAIRAWNHFKNLYVGCTAYTPSTGASFIAACQGGTTTGGNGGNVVVIDPGHGTKTNVRPWEGPDALKASLALQSALQKKNPNLKIIMTRTTNNGNIDASIPQGFPSDLSNKEEVENYRRAQIANENNASAIIHIHSDDGDSQRYMLLYPGAQGKTSSGIAGPAGGGTVTLASAALARAMSTKMKTAGLKEKDGSPFTTNSFYDGGKSIYGYDVPLKSAAAVTVEMFGHGSDNGKPGNPNINSYAKNFDNNVNGAIDKMVNGIADGIVGYLSTLPQGNGAQPQTAPAITPACKIAGLAIETAIDVKAKECKDGRGCENKPGIYNSAKARNNQSELSVYAYNNGENLPFGSKNQSGYSECSRLVGYIMQTTKVDPKFPLHIVNEQLKYVRGRPEKYTMMPYSSDRAQPGDIIFEGSCNTALRGTGGILPGQSSEEIESECNNQTIKGGFHHVQIYVGKNSSFPDKIIAEASLGHRGPMMTQPWSPMNLIARLK